MNIDKLLQFTKAIHDFRAIERRVLTRDSERLENDVEHSYTLAMLAWYILEENDLKLDLKKVLQYALVHDLVEIYAGDTYIFTKDTKKLESKEEREKEAQNRLKQEFPELKEVHEYIERYEKKEDEESVFVYALDKLEPIMAIYLDKGRTWKRENIDLATIIAYKEPKISLSPLVKEYFDAIVEKLEKEIFV
jgi:putative hydrolases of HD superfamily